MLKRILALTLIVALGVLSFAGCQSSSGDGAQTPAGDGSAGGDGGELAPAEGSDDELYIHYITARSMTEGTVGAFMEVVDNYKATHPNFTLELETEADRPSYDQKIKTLVASDALPDWFDGDPEPFFEGLVAQGIITNFDEVFDELGVTDRLFRGPLDYVRLDDGSLYLFPWQANTEYFFYHKDHFEDAGAQPPENLDGLFDELDKLVAAGYTKPVTMEGRDFWPIMRWLGFIPFRMEGNDYINGLRTGERSMTEEPGQLTAEFIAKLGGYMPDGWASNDYDTHIDMFVNGETSILYMGTWATGDLTDANLDLIDDVDFFTLPMYRSDDGTTEDDYWVNSGIGTAILADSWNDETKDFMAYLVQEYPDLVITKYNTLPAIMPSQETVDSLPYLYKSIMENLERNKIFAHCWDVRVDPATRDVMGKETINLAMGLTSVDEYCERIDAAIAENAPSYFG